MEIDKEILWNIINSLLAGGIFFAGSFSATTHITMNAILTASIISLGVALTQFREYWMKQELPVKSKKMYAFKFI